VTGPPFGDPDRTVGIDPGFDRYLENRFKLSRLGHSSAEPNGQAEDGHGDRGKDLSQPLAHNCLPPSGTLQMSIRSDGALSRCTYKEFGTGLQGSTGKN
jgi:hypothetical protein